MKKIWRHNHQARDSDEISQDILTLIGDEDGN
jgi:hypothetical protein